MLSSITSGQVQPTFFRSRVAIFFKKNDGLWPDQATARGQWPERRDPTMARSNHAAAYGNCGAAIASNIGVSNLQGWPKLFGLTKRRNSKPSKNPSPSFAAIAPLVGWELPSLSEPRKQALSLLTSSKSFLPKKGKVFFLYYQMIGKLCLIIQKGRKIGIV